MHLSWRTALCLFGAVSSVYLAACEDSLHLDPATTTGSTTAGAGGGSSGSGGGGGHAQCTSNVDCGIPNPVCDTTTDKCVQCLVVNDCGGVAGAACSFGKCVCAAPSEKICSLSPGQPPVCVDTSNNSSACGDCGHVCYGQCTSGACADPWEPLPTVDAPSPRALHAAVWTGAQMIVWGGLTPGGPTASGGVYDPTARTWKATAATGAPSARSGHTAVWDSKHKLMLVWGGLDSTGAPLDTGAAYDPAKDAWTKIAQTAAPSARSGHTAVFSGTVMIVWGGSSDGSTGLADGARYDAGLSKWTAVGVAPPALDARFDHGAAFGGAGMFVWGGSNSSPLSTGGFYTVGTDSWTVASTAPTARQGLTMSVTAAGAFLVFGGEASAAPAFPPDGWSYDHTADTWNQFNNSVPNGRVEHTAVMVGTGTNEKMIIWGGAQGGSILGDGAKYDVTLNAWDPPGSVPSSPAPLARHQHTAVSDGRKMYVFGGRDPGSNFLGDGGVFDSAFTPP